MSDIRRTVLETLSQHGTLPIDEIARAAHLSTMAMRYHLTLLVEEGLIVADTVNHRAAVGRPQVLYALADDAHEHLPKQYAWLAEQLLDEFGKAYGEKEKRALMRRAGRHMATLAPAMRPNARIESRVKHTANFLSERGYMARWEKEADEFRLYVCNCPYRQVMRTHPQVCDMDIAMVGELLGTPAKMSTCMANQDCACSFVVKAKTEK